MDGEWVESLTGGRARYYITQDGKRTFVIDFLDANRALNLRTSIIILVHSHALIYSGNYTREEAERFYKIACGAEDNDSAHRAVLAYMKMKGIYQ